jgi:hypothetical protein
MWNRRDIVLLATAAVATFGLTVATFWSRSAHAVGETPAATTEVKVPTLDLGDASVTAALDAEHERTVILTVRNLSASTTTAKFSASAAVVPPSSGRGRTLNFGQSVWSQGFAVDLEAGQTKAISVALPETAFIEAKPALGQTPKNTPTVSGDSYVTLYTTDAAPRRQSIRALTLITVKPEPTTVAKGNS